MNLNHNKPNSMLRRIPGLSDAEWSSMVINVDIGVELNKTSFMVELIRFCLDKPNYHFVLHMIGVRTDIPFGQLISETNFDHANFRFFRHFCPENIRNGLHHSALPFAKLVKTSSGKYIWISVLRLVLRNNVNFLTNFSVGDELDVILSGINNVDTIEIKKDEISILHYIRGKHHFGEKMWQLKQLIYKNKG